MITIFIAKQIMDTRQDDTQQFEEQIEKDLLELIAANLQEGKMELSRAQELSKEFLALLPFENKADLLMRLKAFAQKNQDVQGVYIKYAAIEEKAHTADMLQRMSQHLRNGNIEEALGVVKGEK